MLDKDRKFVKAYVNDDIYNWVDAQADSMGMSKSAFVNMCISQYRHQVQALASFSQFDNYLDRLQGMIDGQNGKGKEE